MTHAAKQGRDEYATLAFLYDPATAWALDPLRRDLAGLAAREVLAFRARGGRPGPLAEGCGGHADGAPHRGSGHGLECPVRAGLADLPVLDVCCGTGRQCRFFAARGLRAVGLDLSPAMLARTAGSDDARGVMAGFGRRAGEDLLGPSKASGANGQRLPGPGFVQGDATRLPFPDASFAFVSVCLALHEKPPEARPVILAEMRRVAAPGAALAVADYLRPSSAAGRLLSLGVKTVERLAGREHHAHYAHFMRGGGLDGLLREAGLRPLEIRPHVLGLIGLAVIVR